MSGEPTSPTPAAAPSGPAAQPSQAPVPSAPAASSPVDATVEQNDSAAWETFNNDYEPPAAEPQPEPSAAAAADATTIEPAPVPDPSLATAPLPEPAADKAAQSPADAAIAEVNSPEWQQARLTQLEQGYQLSPEEAEAFETDPVKAMPNLMAKAHLRLAYQMTQMVSTMMEQMLLPVVDQRVTHHGNMQQARSRADELIYKPFPKLREVPDNVIQTVVQTVRAASPGISGADGLKRVAATIYGMYGWQLPQSGATQARGPAPGLPPYQPVAPGSVPPRPAQAGSKQVDAQGTDWADFDEQ